MSKQIPVRVARAASEPPLGGDLFGWIDVVADAVAREYDVFGASDGWDVWPVEVHLDHVIVRDYGRNHFYQANIVVNTDRERVEFANIQRVVNQWVPVDDDQVERGEVLEVPELATVLVNRAEAPQGPPSVFAGLLS